MGQKLVPRQLFNQRGDASYNNHCSSGSNSDENDSAEASYSRSSGKSTHGPSSYLTAQAPPLSFSSSMPVRERSLSRSHTAREQQRTVAPQLQPPAEVDFIPLTKSFSDGEIDIKNVQERGSSQSPLRLLAARNNLETPTRASEVIEADYDSEKGSSDYESEEEDKERKRRDSGGGGILRRRVTWQRTSPSSFDRTRATAPSPPGRSRGVWLCILLLLAVEACGLFYLGYTYRQSYTAVSLQEFGGFVDTYPHSEVAHTEWLENPLHTCRQYTSWLNEHKKMQLASAARHQARPTATPGPNDWHRWGEVYGRRGTTGRQPHRHR